MLRSNPSRLWLRIFVGLAVFLCLRSGSGRAETPPGDTPAERGQSVVSMGQPRATRFLMGGDVGLKPISDREFVGRLSFGFERTMFNPLVQVFAVTGEYYFGISGQAKGEVGLRLGLESPAFHFGGGWQYDYREEKTRSFVSFRHPLRRGGVFWPGGQLRVLWYPRKEQSLTVGVTVPLAQPFAGRTRPRTTRATVPQPVADVPPVFQEPSPGARAALDRLAVAAERVRHFTVPYIDHDARSRGNAVEKFSVSMATLAAELEAVRREAAAAGRVPTGDSPPEMAVRELHAALVDAFRDAAVRPLTPELLAQVARSSLLDELILPYNRLLGQKKDRKVFDELAARARVAFSRDVVLRERIRVQDIAPAEAVFDRVLEIVRRGIDAANSDWEDDRLVWIPLQYALLPEDHDTQDELDAILARAVDQPLTTGNQVWYVVAEQFQYELLRMINATRLYHVLWIHDIRGYDDSNEPDAVTYRIVMDGYLNALAERLEAYDREGILPVYMIFIDQWYYEARKGRLWLRLLEDPLGYEMDLPKGFETWEQEIRAAQDRIRRAIDNSGLLQAEIREYGEDWLRNRVRVQVNVTNPADPTFWTWETLPWVGFRDDFIRDHRKITFYDVNPLDPQQGMAVYTGMGVGEHYTGATWDDRAIRVKGPALLSLRQEARELLLQQGFRPDQIPFPLRDDKGDPWGRVASTAGGSRAVSGNDVVSANAAVGSTGTRVIELHNHIGYGPKLATVGKATLYSLMPRGSVVKTPDSIWNQPLWGSLLLGLALRGGRVTVIAPTYDAAPARSGVSLSRAQEVLGRLVIAGDLLADPLRETGGLLKVGLYNPAAAVGDIPGKARQVVRTYRETPWLAELHGLHPDVLNRVEALADSMTAAGFQARYLEGQPLDNPRLHMKAQFFATATGWDSLVSRPEFGDFLCEYLRQRAEQVAERGQDRDLTQMTESLMPSMKRLYKSYESVVSESDRERALWYFLVGSQNQNYRSMSVDGEVIVTVAGLDASVGLADFVIVLGMSTWIDTPEELDTYLPAAGGLRRKMARWLQGGS